MFDLLIRGGWDGVMDGMEWDGGCCNNQPNPTIDQLTASHAKLLSEVERERQRVRAAKEEELAFYRKQQELAFKKKKAEERSQLLAKAPPQHPLEVCTGLLERLSACMLVCLLACLHSCMIALIALGLGLGGFDLQTTIHRQTVLLRWSVRLRFWISKAKTWKSRCVALRCIALHCVALRCV